MPSKQVATVEEVGRRLEEWRQSRRHKRAAIPDELWSAAIEVARRDGLGRSSIRIRVKDARVRRTSWAMGVEVLAGFVRRRRKADSSVETNSSAATSETSLPAPFALRPFPQ